LTRRRLRDAALTAGFGVLVAFVVVAPLTRRGWLLLLDWAPGPRGIGPTGTAAIPAGPAFVWPAQLAHLMFGAAVGWLPIAVALGIAAAGGAQLMAEGPWAARVAAGVAFAWNPFVFDRIAAGQVAFLAGYALLPWLTRAALRASSLRGALIVGVWWAAASLCTLHFVWIGGAVVLAVALARLSKDAAGRIMAGAGIAAAVVVVAAGTWALLAHGDAPARGPVRVLSTFGTTSDPDLGRTLGILAQQGFWRVVVTRPRDDLGGAFSFVACAVIALAACGIVLARRTSRARLAGAGAIAAVIGWLLGHGSAGPAGGIYRALFLHLPGFAVMREAQKWVALVALGTAIGLGCVAAAIAGGRARGARAFSWLVVVAPVVLAPSLAWGLAGRLTPSRYPASWQAVRTAAAALPADVIALPWEHYTRPGITGNRTVANIAPAYFGSRVLVSDDPRLIGVPADTGRRAAIAAAIATAQADVRAGRPLRLGRALRSLGVHGVLVVGDNAEVPLADDPDLVATARAPHAVLWTVRPA